MKLKQTTLKITKETTSKTRMHKLNPPYNLNSKYD